MNPETLTYAWTEAHRLERLLAESDAYAAWSECASLGAWERVVCPVHQSPEQEQITTIQGAAEAQRTGTDR